MEENHVGKRIKARRLALGLTQEELAKRTGYSGKSSIAQIENTRSMPLKKIQKFADALKCSPSDLIWDDDQEKIYSLITKASNYKEREEEQGQIETIELIISRNSKNTAFMDRLIAYAKFLESNL